MFNQRKNKRFSYKTRLQNSNKTESKHDFEAKWNIANSRPRRKGNVLTSLPALFIMLVLLFVLMYILNGYIK